MTDKTAEDMPETRAEALRRMYYRDDGWHTTNNAQIGRGGSLDHLVKAIVNYKPIIQESSDELKKAQKKLSDAQHNLNSTQDAFNRNQIDLDILKLALSDLLEIPQ